jgi:hypothetical protein
MENKVCRLALAETQRSVRGNCPVGMAGADASSPFILGVVAASANSHNT